MLDEIAVVNSYIPYVTSLREISRKFNTNHHTIRRILNRHGVEIVRPKKGPMSEDTKKKLSNVRKGKKRNISPDWKMPISSLYKNMKAHLRFDVELEFLEQFEDVEKLKFLNRSLTNRDDRWGDIDADWYIKFITKFYYDEQFNSLYTKWELSKHDKYLKPSIDHKVPKSKGGNNDLDNLQFLSWFENRCKNDIDQEHWTTMKNNISDYFV